MVNRYLARDEAPISAQVWDLLNGVMVRAARSQLVGRRLLYLEGPFGLGLKAISLQDAERESGVIAGEVLPVLMIRERFLIGIRDLAHYEQEGGTLDLGTAMEAVLACARLEDELIFQGKSGVPGLLTAVGTQKLTLSSWEAVGVASADLIQGIGMLDQAGFHGPYALALAPKLYNLLLRLNAQGTQTELEHLKTIVTDGILKAPALDHGGVLLASGQQYVSIVLGQDMTIGFVGPVDNQLEFSILESLTLRIRQPRAICILGP